MYIPANIYTKESFLFFQRKTYHGALLLLREVRGQVSRVQLCGTTMSRPLCEKPECPQPGKKRKATVAHTGKENEQEGGSEPPYERRRTLMEARFRVHASHTCRLLLGRPRLL